MKKYNHIERGKKLNELWNKEKCVMRKLGRGCPPIIRQIGKGKGRVMMIVEKRVGVPDDRAVGN